MHAKILIVDDDADIVMMLEDRLHASGYDTVVASEGQQALDHLVEGFLRLMRSSVRSPVNLGNPGEFTVRELATIVLDMTSSSSELVTMPLPFDDPKVRRPDISLARTALGWEPKVALRDGLSRTIAYFDGLLTNRSSASISPGRTLAL